MADMLATASDLASYLQKDVDTATATLAIETATATIQEAVGQRLVQVIDDTVIIDRDLIDSSPFLELPELPVTAIGTVKVGALTVVDFTTELSRGRLYRWWGWRYRPVFPYAAPTTVTVTYTHGYPAGDQGLELARMYALVLAAGMYENPNMVIREQSDDYSVQYNAPAPGLTVEMMTALRRRYGRRRSQLLVRR